MVKSTIGRRPYNDVIQRQRDILKQSRERSDQLVKKAETLGVKITPNNKQDTQYKEAQ
jgi:hypothetical protein